jgi:hypothetical protein
MGNTANNPKGILVLAHAHQGTHQSLPYYFVSLLEKTRPSARATSGRELEEEQTAYRAERRYHSLITGGGLTYRFNANQPFSSLHFYYSKFHKFCQFFLAEREEQENYKKQRNSRND